jgi:hypothetical protein
MIYEIKKCIYYFLFQKKQENMSEITPAQKTALLKLEGFKEIRDQYAKEQKMAGSGKKRRMKGRGFWGDVWDWFKSAGTSINDFLKRTKLISNVAGAVLPLIAPIGAALLTANPIAAAGASAAGKSVAEGIKSLGYGKMMMGKGNDPLSINPPNQRMRGINPKSKMRGAGLLENVFSTIAPLAGTTISNVQNRASYVKKMTGRGYGTTNNTFGSNGMPQKVTAPAHSGMMGNIGGRGKGRPSKMKGMGGTEYGSVSSEFGNVAF